MDIHYPEIYTTLALKGAEIIFWPSAAMDYTGDLIESIVNARAVDNQVYFVVSHFVQLPYLAGKHYGRSRASALLGCNTDIVSAWNGDHDQRLYRRNRDVVRARPLGQVSQRRARRRQRPRRIALLP